MPEPITNHQLAMLSYIGKHPDLTREQLQQVTKATDAELQYLERHDMIREREPGRYRIAHFGEMVLRRGLNG